MSLDDSLAYWNEVTKLVQDLIQSTQCITTGAENKLGQWDMKSQYDHINSEVLEAFVEYVQSDSAEQEIDEDMDILMTVLTLFHKKGYGAMDIKFSIGRMLSKYNERGFIKLGKTNV